MIGRVNAGGGGGLQSTDAILRVIAPAGSTVTISKGGVSKSDAGHENAADPSLYDYYFIIHQSQFDSVNPWTVTATLGAQTKSDTIVIDSANEYDLALSFRLWLVKDGISQFGEITALALKTSSSAGNSNKPDISYGTGYIQIGWSSNAPSGTGGGGIAYFSDEKIDLSAYDIIHTSGSVRNNAGDITYSSVNAWTDIGTDQTANRVLQSPVYNSTSSSYVTFASEADISLLTSSCYIGVNGQRGTSGYTSMRIENMWLE